MLREDLKVYEEKDFTFLNFVTFPLSKPKVHANLSVLLLKKTSLQNIASTRTKKAFKLLFFFFVIVRHMFMLLKNNTTMIDNKRYENASWSHNMQLQCHTRHIFIEIVVSFI